MADKKLDPRIEKVALAIKNLRINAGYSSAESFAFDHDIPRVQYWRLESGANLTMASLLRLLDIHKISLEEFAKGAGL